MKKEPKSVKVFRVMKKMAFALFLVAVAFVVLDYTLDGFLPGMRKMVFPLGITYIVLMTAYNVAKLIDKKKNAYTVLCTLDFVICIRVNERFTCVRLYVVDRKGVIDLEPQYIPGYEMEIDREVDEFKKRILEDPECPREASEKGLMDFERFLTNKNCSASFGTSIYEQQRYKQMNAEPKSVKVFRIMKKTALVLFLLSVASVILDYTLCEFLPGMRKMVIPLGITYIVLMTAYNVVQSQDRGKCTRSTSSCA